MRRREAWGVLVLGALLLGAAVTQVSPFVVGAAAAACLVGAIGLLASRNLVGDELRIRMLLLAWAIYFISGQPLRIRAATDIAESALDPAASLRVLMVAAVGLVVLALLFGRAERVASSAGRPLFSGAVLLVAYGVFALLSSLWSVSPMWTAYKSAEYLVGLVLALLFALSIRNLDDLKAVVNLTWAMFGTLLVFVWIGFLVAPSRAMVPTKGLLGWRLGGVFPVASTNTVGDLAATVLLVVLVRLLYSQGSRRWLITFLVAAAGALFLSQARSALLGVVAAVIVLSILLPKVRKQGVLLAVGAGSLAYVFVDLVYAYLVRGQSQGNIESLSGRTLYWTAAIELWMKHPIVGAGAYAAGRFGVLQQLGEQLTSSLHNTWIELLVGTGVVGVAIVAASAIAVTVALFRMARAESDSPMGFIPAELGAIVVLELVRSVFTSGAFIWHPATRFMLAVIVCVSYATAGEKLSAPEADPGVEPSGSDSTPAVGDGGPSIGPAFARDGEA